LFLPKYPNMPKAQKLVLQVVFAFMLSAVLCAVPAMAQGGIGSSIQGLSGAQSSTDDGNTVSDIRGQAIAVQPLQPVSTWSTPALAEQRPLFGPVDESAYMVGPGDHFHVATGVRFFNVVVGPEGYLVIDGVPPIAVSGLSLKAARAQVSEKLSRYYRRDAIQIRLSQAKRFQVLIAGSVNRPGLHPMEYGSRVSHALDAAGGYSGRATRHLTLQRASGETLSLDLRKFFVEGNLSQNPMLQQGDRIVAPGLNGSIRLVYMREGPNLLGLPYHEGETLEDFVLRFDNYRDGRVWRAARLYDSSGQFEIEISRDRAAARVLAPGATVEIQYAKSSIFIGGMVVRPGTLEYNATMTAMDYLAQAGIMVGTSDVRRIDILGSDGKKRRVNVTRDALQPGDHILVPRSYESTFRDYIAIISAISSLAVAFATFVVLTEG
jgi:protein involved in polysaccharide export with SLBB domain